MSGTMRWLVWLQGVVVAVVLAAILAPLLYGFIITVTGGSATSQDGRQHLQTKNSTRYAGASTDEVAQRAAEAAFASIDGQPITVPLDDWRAVSVSASYARNLQRPLLPGSASVDLAQQQVDALAAYMETRVYPGPRSHVVVVNRDDPLLAAPFVAWSSFSGAPLLFAGEAGLDAGIAEALRQASPELILAAPGLPDAVVEELDAIAPVERVGDSDPIRNALDLARFDAGGAIGWAYDENDADPAFHNFHLVNRDQPELAVFAGALAGRAKPGPLLLTEREAPEQVKAMIWRVKPDWIVTPAEGPFNHLTFLGSLDDISWNQQGELDWASEIQVYTTQGPGLSSWDAVTMGWVILSLCCGAWITLNALFRLPMMPPNMRMVWGLLGVLLGPFAVALYLYAYNSVAAVQTRMGMHYRRSFAGESMVATAMGIAFGASIMIAVAFFLAYFGMPLIVFDGPVFWLGSPMILMLILMWLGAVLIALPIFQVPMLLMNGLDRARAWKFGAFSVLISMTAASLGMMSTNWFFQSNSFLDPAFRSAFHMMQSEESIQFTGALLIASIVGFVTALPFNALLILRGWRPGLG